MLVESTMTSVGDGVETESLRLSVRFDVEENSAADQPHEHPPSPPPPSMMDSSSSPNLKSKESKSYGTPFRETKSTKTPSPKGHRSFHSADLRSNLTREQRDRDPLFFYETVRTLGVGSMGSVARVKKRVNTVGGSARKGMQEVVRRQNRHKHCLNIPVIGGIFRVCVDGALQGPTSTLTNPNCGGGFLASWFRPKESPLTSSNESRSVQSAPSLHRIDSVGSMGSMTSNGSRSTASRQAIEYAMKSIHLSRVTDKTFLTELRNEISILKKLDHPHIVRAIETFEHRNQIFIIMELCSGGDLYSRDPYTEEDAARIVSSILSAIAYMHTKKILHRDLKYENVLFVNNSPKAEIKLIDFGLSKVYGDNTELTEGVGTIYTMAPEVLKGAYSEKADVWSVGVIAYMLLSSQMPFYGRKRRHIVEQILNGQFDFRGRRWKRISSQAKAFVEELLVLDDEERVDAQTAMRSTWLNRRFAATVRGPDPEEENMARHAMLRYAGYTKLKKMVRFWFLSFGYVF